MKFEHKRRIIGLISVELSWNASAHFFSSPLVSVLFGAEGTWPAELLGHNEGLGQREPAAPAVDLNSGSFYSAKIKRGCFTPLKTFSPQPPTPLRESKVINLINLLTKTAI